MYLAGLMTLSQGENRFSELNVFFFFWPDPRFGSPAFPSPLTHVLLLLRRVFFFSAYSFFLLFPATVYTANELCESFFQPPPTYK
jgi:hypothetical protein